jgi:uncharacterized membrane protein HdeD (DUF308 family)
MCAGGLALAVGVLNAVMFLARWRHDAWAANLFLGSVGTLAGYVLTVRPLYRLARGGSWWKVE